MRIVHTADWHLGKTLYGKDRTEDEKKALSYLKEFIRENDIDLLVIAGDIFDKFIPSSRAEEVLVNFLVDVRKIGTKIVMIAGNHDNGLHFSSMSPIFRFADIHSFGKVSRNSHFVFQTKSGESVFVAAIPFIREAEVLDIEEYDLPEHVTKAKYAEKMGNVFKWFEKRFIDDGINLVVTHLLIGGAHTSGTEHKFYLANSYAVPPLSLPETANYIAAGHIHKYQRIDNPSPAYYSGSLFPLDFGEQDEKGFIFLEVKPGLPPEKIEFVPVPHRDLEVVDIEEDEIFSFIERYSGFDGYLKVNLDTKGKDARELIDRIKKALPQVIAIHTRMVEKKKKRTLEMDDILDPVRSYRSYYKEKKGVEPDREIIEVFEKLYRKVRESED